MLDLLELARKNLTESSESASYCYNDAIKAYQREDFEACRMWCIKSLSHSVGIFHKDYKKALTLYK